ncbi:MAG: ATP phosphoribosyltransferase regulatory subunit [Nitrospinae bacterium]|nr:ATP phosphoribosyltransferase regulatory subunit [Nitrospinota bacterium]
MIDAPRGVKALLFEEATLKGHIESRILSLLESWGYMRVETPAMEFFHVLSRGLDAETLKRVITFTDPAGGGKPLALRSDVTPQIARLAATSLYNRPKPVRLCYAATVYRSQIPGAGGRMEVYQAGAELVGLSSPEADAEILALALESLARLGLADGHISLSHAGYIKSIVDELGLAEPARAEVKLALKKKDMRGLERALENHKTSGPAREALLAAPTLFGGVELAGKAKAVNKGSEEALINLSKIIELLVKRGLGAKVTLDLGETRGMGYYTGVTFEGFVKGIGKRVLSGGRYDKLLSLYGADIPGAGFAIDVDRILDHFTRAGEPAGWAPADATLVELNDAVGVDALAARLREHGFRIVQELISRPIHEIIKEAAGMKIMTVIVCGDKDTPPDMVKIIDTADGKETKAHAEDMMGRPANYLHRRKVK